MIQRLILFGCLGLFGMTVTAGSILGAATNTKDPIALIREDYQAGKLTFDQKAILIAQAVRKPEALPAYYQFGISAAEPRYVTRDVTMSLREIFVNWNQLSDTAQRTIQNILQRWPVPYTYVSPSGFFRLHYDTASTETNRVPAADLDMDGVPDYVEKCAAYCDSSMTRQLALGYIAPPSDGSAGGDSKYDVYFESMGYYGYAQPELPGPQPWGDYTSYLVLHNNFLGFPPNTDPEGNQAGAAKVTCAHELHHAIQFAYSIAQPGWYMEEDATAMETVVFPHTNDNYNYLPDFFTSPATSLMTENGSHEYASCLWGWFLMTKFDTLLTVQAWRGARYNDIFATVSDTLLARFGWTQDSAMAEFAVWNYCTSIHNDGLHYIDASNYPAMQISQTYSSLPVTTQTTPDWPAGYAASYIQFNTTGYTGRLRISFDGDNSRQWAAYLIKSTSDNSHQFQKISLDVNGAGFGDVYGIENLKAVTLVGVNISENSNAAAFTYSAQLLPPYQFTTNVLTDTNLYAGNTRAFKYKVKNVSSASEIVKTVWWDQVGWAVKDSSTKFLLAGDSSIISVNVKPPAYFPVGSTSTLHFNSICLSDSSLTKQDTLTEAVMLYRGDVNKDGIIDASDLAYFVAFLTSGGSEPEPTREAGNFSCSGLVDATDLAMLVSYLTGLGARPACNPF